MEEGVLAGDVSCMTHSSPELHDSTSSSQRSMRIILLLGKSQLTIDRCFALANHFAQYSRCHLKCQIFLGEIRLLTTKFYFVWALSFQNTIKVSQYKIVFWTDILLKPVALQTILPCLAWHGSSVNFWFFEDICPLHVFEKCLITLRFTFDHFTFGCLVSLSRMLINSVCTVATLTKLLLSVMYHHITGSL